MRADGTLWLLGTLDREAVAEYSVVVQATDRSVLRKSSRVVIKTTILDFNDNRPIVTNLPISVSIRESAAIGDFVAELIATDADDGVNKLRKFAIIDGNDNQTFGIDEEDGIVSVAGAVDGARLDLFTLLVAIRDQGLPQLEAVVSVTIRVIHFGAPEFATDPYHIDVFEDHPLAEAMLQVWPPPVCFLLFHLSNFVPQTFVISAHKSELHFAWFRLRRCQCMTLPTGVLSIC